MKKIIVNLLTYTGIAMCLATWTVAQQPPQNKRQNKETDNRMQKDSLLRNYDNNKWNDSVMMIPIDTPPSPIPDSIPGKMNTPGNR